MERALTRHEFDVMVAATIEEARQLAQRRPPEYATLDLKLEESSGLQFLPTLLSISPACRVVILTGYSSITTAVEAIKLGAVNYLCKPVEVSEVLQALDTQEGNPDAEIAENPPSVNRLTWSTSSVCCRTTMAIFRPRPAVWVCTGAPCSANCKSARSSAEYPSTSAPFFTTTRQEFA